jgi:hypothetical protein
MLTGATALGTLTFLLPLANSLESPQAARIAAYALVLASVALLLHGLLLAASGYTTPRLLALGAASAIGALIVLFVYLASLENGSRFVFPLALSVTNLLRILAAASVGVSLARYVSSTGVVLLIAAVAVASDVFSFFAGPTKILLEEGSPALGVLMLVFPTFGSTLGFALGISDFILLALFAAASRSLNLRYPATLLGLCLATFLAVTTGLLLERPLPALPFIALAFVLVNADLILPFIARRP